MKSVDKLSLSLDYVANQLRIIENLRKKQLNESDLKDIGDMRLAVQAISIACEDMIEEIEGVESEEYYGDL